MIKGSLKILTLVTLVSVAINAKPIPIYNYYLDITYDSAKNSIMGGATTATAKGYSAMSSNPAGLSTNYNATIYARIVGGGQTDIADDSLPDISPDDHAALGLLYNSFAVEYKVDDHIIGSGAYGYESEYGLFSIGVSYLLDQTDLTKKNDSPVQDDMFATGDYLTYGIMWQKSFIGEEDFYALYFGISHKNSGKYEGDVIDGGTTVVPVSPSRTSYGIGLETNVFDTSVLFTLDMSEEFWQSIGDTLSGMSYGAKWMINQKFAIVGGLSNKTFSGSKFKDTQVVGLGLEFGFLGFHTNTAFTQRKVNVLDGGTLTQQALHLDVAFTF